MAEPGSVTAWTPSSAVGHAAACAALASRNMQHELAIHMDAALRVGASREEVAEVMFQIAVYAGVPCMVEGMQTLKKVLEERGEWVEKP